MEPVEATSIRTPWGKCDLKVDHRGLVTTPELGWLELHQKVAMLSLGASIVVAVIGSYLPDPWDGVLIGVAAALLLIAVVAALLDYLMAAVAVVLGLFKLTTRSGRSELKGAARGLFSFDRRSGEHVIGWDQIRGVESVRGGLRPTIVVHTHAGLQHLSGWPWRRFGLRRMAHALEQRPVV